jgi:hypothetical protein
MSLVIVASIVELERFVAKVPPRARINGIYPEEYIDGCNSFGKIGCMAFRCALEPYSSRASFPAFSPLVLFRGHGVQWTDPNVKDNTISITQLCLAPALDVDISMLEPAAGEIKIGLNAVPFGCVKPAT